MENPQFTVSQFIDIANQTLDYAFGSILVEGEVASFKVNQSKYIFFDLKDQEDNSSLSCFMMAYQLRLPIEDGMKVVVRATPKITAWGKFSLTVQSITPVGEGSLKKSFQILKNRLEKEGLFSAERKRQLPKMPTRLGVISSTAAAGYADFIKMLGSRWGGLEIITVNTQVQGDVAADQIIAAIDFFNQQEDLVDVLVIVRGGGSADDLASFNDEKLVRAIAASRIPVLTGIGHETDESLADLAADVSAFTPTNAAQVVVPDRHYIIDQFKRQLQAVPATVNRQIDFYMAEVEGAKDKVLSKINNELERAVHQQKLYQSLIDQVNPKNVLYRGYAILRGEATVGKDLEIETFKQLITAEVKNVRQKQ